MLPYFNRNKLNKNRKKNTERNSKQNNISDIIGRYTLEKIRFTMLKTLSLHNLTKLTNKFICLLEYYLKNKTFTTQHQTD